MTPKAVRAVDPTQREVCVSARASNIAAPGARKFAVCCKHEQGGRSTMPRVNRQVPSPASSLALAPLSWWRLASISGCSHWSSGCRIRHPHISSPADVRGDGEITQGHRMIPSKSKFSTMSWIATTVSRLTVEQSTISTYAVWTRWIYPGTLGDGVHKAYQLP